MKLIGHKSLIGIKVTIDVRLIKILTLTSPIGSPSES